MILVDGEQVPWREGMTVTSLLREKPDAHQFAVVRIDSRYVSRPDFDTFVIPDGAVIWLIPMIAGG